MGELTARHRLRFAKGLSVMAVAVLLVISYTSMVCGGSVGGVVDDTIITTKIKSSFMADPTVSALDIGVDTSQGVVTLTGIVNNEQERQRAIHLAQETAGVKQVSARNLVVKR